MKASILCIGSELTAGQILNRNTQWIASQLSALGVPCTLHIAVPDQHELIIKSLNLLELESDLLFLTGGLGPTTDDLTRQVVADWAHLKLIFDDNSWKHLGLQLAKKGVLPKEIHRQECSFPEHSEIYQNRVGTANAFHFQTRNKSIFVLPGPPKEIEAIWRDFVLPRLSELTEKIDRFVTHQWQTSGKSESDIATLVLAVTNGCPFEIGYRVHLPNIEVKLSYFQSQIENARPWIEKIEIALQPHLNPVNDHL